MKICFLNNKEHDEDRVGGGLTFWRNFTRCLKELGHEITYDIHSDWNIGFVAGATMVQRERFRRAERCNKPIVLRVDGIPEDWRNRGTGWSRLRDYANRSDLVIYQSCFSRDTVGRLLGFKGPVVLNGVDTDIFTPKGDKFPRFGNPSLVYINYRKGEHNKRVEEAIELFRQFKLDNPDATITFIGRFSKRQFLWDNAHWDFGMLDWKEGKDWRYQGIIKDRKKLAKAMRSHDFIVFPSFADPCPNTLIEAICCGLNPMWINSYGGQFEIAQLGAEYDWSAERMTSEYISEMEKLV